MSALDKCHGSEVGSDISTLHRELEKERNRADRLHAAVIALGDALERQRRIDELSPAARALEQRAIDQTYSNVMQLLTVEAGT